MATRKVGYSRRKRFTQKRRPLTKIQKQTLAKPAVIDDHEIIEYENVAENDYDWETLPATPTPNQSPTHSVDVAPPADREIQLACKLADNAKVQRFTFDVFYYYLQSWMKYYPDQWKTIIGDKLLEKINGNIVERIGFSPEEREHIYATFHNKSEVFAYLKTKFHKMTSVINNLSEPGLTYYIVNINTAMQQRFVKNVKELFLLNQFSWEDFKELYSSSPNSHKRSYNFFVFNVIVYGTNGDISLYNKNLVYSDFIRKSQAPEKQRNAANLKKFTRCNKSAISSPNYAEYQIYDANNYYEMDENSPFSKIMKKHGNSYLAGPSGSTALLYINVFDFYAFPRSYKNEIRLLCMLIADLIPLWHTLPEVLLSANVELHTPRTVNKYTLDMDAVDYVQKLIHGVLDTTK
jgi:hypothetical protein